MTRWCIRYRPAPPLFEYACHEDNHGMTNLLADARAQEHADRGAATAR